MKWDRSRVLAVASLLVCIVVVALWVCSFASEAILLESDRGQCLLIGIDAAPAKSVRTSRDAVTLDEFLTTLQSPPPTLNGVAVPRPREACWLGFLWVRGEVGKVFVPGTENNNFWMPPFWIVGVPYWFIVLITAAPALRWMWLRARQARRARLNLCRGCGYDLRGTSQRCPECGDEAQAARLTSSTRETSVS